MTPRLELEAVSAGYGEQPVLWDVSLVVRAGEVVALLGANGAGKSTTLRAIAGVIGARGAIRLDGHEITGLPPQRISRLGVALVPEDRGTFAELSVEDNLRIGAFGRRDRVAVERDVAGWLEVHPALAAGRSRPAGQLSGGLQQLLAVARALMSRPRLLLLDEASRGLSSRLRAELLGLVAARCREGTAVLAAEQDLGRARLVAERGYVLGSGRIRLDGPLDSLGVDAGLTQVYLGP